jgi:4-hydroxy-tetrahydrodipicolinate synthase
MTIGRHVAKLTGYAPELPTPFDGRGCICDAAFERLCELQIENGATALVVGGATGESANLTHDEHARLIRIAANVSGKQVPVIADAGSNATAHAIELTKEAEINGADAILSVTPYYNKPTQEGLNLHFAAIASSTSLPIFLHDAPARCGREIADETIARLAELPQIIGLMDSSGDTSRLARLRPLVGPDFRLLSGDDATAHGFMAQGGDGCISVISNIAPGLCRDAFLAWRQGNTSKATRLAHSLGELVATLYVEPSPGPLKYAMSLLGLISSAMRSPLVEPGEQARTSIASTLIRFNEYAGALIGTLGAVPVQARRFSASGRTRM